MRIDEINKITYPILKAFPKSYGKVFFNEAESIWQEGISIDYEEAAEFRIVNDIIPKPDNLMCVAGYLKNDTQEDVDVYCVYSYGEREGEGKVHFITIVLDKTYTYDCLSNRWTTWER